MDSNSMHPVAAFIKGGWLVSASYHRCRSLSSMARTTYTGLDSNIFLKLEHLQPSGSFKSRGIGNMMSRAALSTPSPDVRYYCSSGGNAGLACATTAISLKKKAIIVVPQTTSSLMLSKLKALDAEIHLCGNNWGEADRYLHEELLAHDPNGVYVPPFDHPWVWDGAASLAEELYEQMLPLELDCIDGISCSVGGGGLLNGLAQGVDSIKWPMGRKPKLLAVETKGADSLNASLVAGEHISLPSITSIASSLGAPRVSKRSWEIASEPNSNVVSMTVSDADAAMSCVRFADDARIVVEIACGAAIAPVYNGDLRRSLGHGLTDAEWSQKNIVLIVCGGSNVNLEILERYTAVYGAQVAF
jgi:L-serine/L-threonine ammonia-lyase